MKVRNGELVTVDNRSRRFGSANSYYFVRVFDKDMYCERDLLLTADDLNGAEERAHRNLEDLPCRKRSLTFDQWMAIVILLLTGLLVVALNR